MRTTGGRKTKVHLRFKAVYPHENPETYVLRERTVHVSLTYEGPARIVRTGDQFEHSDNRPVPFKATIRVMAKLSKRTIITSFGRRRIDNLSWSLFPALERVQSHSAFAWPVSAGSSFKIVNLLFFRHACVSLFYRLHHAGWVHNSVA